MARSPANTTRSQERPRATRVVHTRPKAAQCRLGGGAGGSRTGVCWPGKLGSMTSGGVSGSCWLGPPGSGTGKGAGGTGTRSGGACKLNRASAARGRDKGCMEGVMVQLTKWRSWRSGATGFAGAACQPRFTVWGARWSTRGGVAASGGATRPTPAARNRWP